MEKSITQKKEPTASEKLIQRLDARKVEFDVHRHGMAVDIYYKGVKINKTYEHSKDKIKGLHIIGMVKKEVHSMVRRRKFKIKNYEKPKPHLYDFYNVDAIREAIANKDEVVAIDISNCYWETMRQIGAISDYLFMKGMIDKDGKDVKDDYKFSRNASIGSLATNTVIEHHKNGEVIKKTKLKESRYKQINYEVIYSVHEIAKKVSNKLNGEVLLYLTDCFFVKKEHAETVCNILTALKYEYKTKRIWNIRMMANGGSHRILWHDGSQKNGELVNKEYSFSPYTQSHKLLTKKQLLTLA